MVWISPTGGAEPDARVVDEHVEPAVARLVSGDHGLDRVLVGHVAGDLLDLEPLGAEALGGLGELLRAAGGDRQAVALLAEHLGDREADPAGRSGHDRCALRHSDLPAPLDKRRYPNHVTANSSSVRPLALLACLLLAARS